MMVYILKSGACLAAFYLFYKLFLERENMHVFKRWYLLLSLLLAFGIPLITFTYTVPAVTSAQATAREIPLSSGTIQIQEYSRYVNTTVWYGIYGVGVAIFGVLFIKNLTQILFRIKQNIKIKASRFTTVLVQDLVLPHTFFNYIFLNKKKFETQQIPKEVILHEEAHARQKHSLDIVCIEAFQVLFWFNPLIYMLKRAIKLNHEFLADRAVITDGTHTATYQQMLLAFSSNAKQHQLANAINYSLIKKRFTVMTKQTSKRAIGLRSLFLLPLLAVLLYGFSSKVAVPGAIPTHTTTKATLYDTPLQNNTVYVPEKTTPAKDIKIFVSENGTLLVNNQSATLKNLGSKLRQINRNISSEARRHEISAIIYADPSAKMKMITAVKDILKKHGISKITLGTLPPPPPVAVLSESVEIEATPEVEEVIEIEAAELAEIEIEKAALAEELAEVEVERIAEAREAIAVKVADQVLEVIEVEEMAELEEEVEIEEIQEVEQGIEIEEDARVIASVKAPRVTKIPPPPPPVSPAKHVVKMAEQGAVFYYDGKRISADKAIQLVKHKRHINVLTKKPHAAHPVVHLSSKPIVIEN